MSANHLPRNFAPFWAKKWLKTSIRDYLLSAFVWCDTPQGYDFWRRLYSQQEQLEEGRDIVRDWLRIYEAKNKPSKPKSPPVFNPRKESLKMQFATAIQSFRNKPAVDAADECMRILDNHNRAKRRKREGKR